MPAVGPVATATPAQHAVAERRVRSVLSCDVVGFTPFSEARDAEAVRELLSQYFSVARTVIGRLAVTLGAVHEGMVAGGAVNTAARIQSAAEPGHVLVDAPACRLTGSAVGFADAGQHTLKGKAEPQHLWQATRVLSAVGGAQRVDGLEAPLTGRNAELRTIRELFHATADRRVPRLVQVSGPAGVGKSRLGWEFETYADGLDQFVPDPSEQAYVGARLGRLPGVAFAGDSGATLGREELFAGWRLFFERLAAVRPVVLLIEDAQHADGGLLAVNEARVIAQRLRCRPLLDRATKSSDRAGRSADVRI